MSTSPNQYLSLQNKTLAMLLNYNKTNQVQENNVQLAKNSKQLDTGANSRRPLDRLQ